MKNKCTRFLSLLLALVMVIGLMPMGHAHAEEAAELVVSAFPATEIESGAKYVIATGRKDRPCRTMINVNAKASDDKYGIELIDNTPMNLDLAAHADAIWTVTGVEGGYTISVDGTNNVRIDGNNKATLAEDGLVQIRVSQNSGYGSGYFEIYSNIEGTDYFLNYFDSFGNVTASGTAAAVWSSNDEGSQWKLHKLLTVAEYEAEMAVRDPFGKVRGLWTKVSVDTETIYNAKEGKFEYAWDNNPGTHWHSNWNGTEDKLTGTNTFAGVIDFGQAYLINQFSFTPRTDKSDGTGIVTQASLLVKENEDDEWITVANHLTFGSDYTKKDINFEAQNVRYVKFVAEQASDGWVTVSEFDVAYNAPAHEHNYEAVVTAPTCTEGGYTTYTCECSDTYVADETEALGHQYDNDQDTDCNRCGETREVADPDRVSDMVAAMSLRDKVTQMMMVDFRKWGETSLSATDFTVMNDEVRKIVEDYNFGSVIYFANNIKTTEETFALTQEMQAAATKDGGIALIICADQEGGSVYRLGSGTALPGNMALGATYANNGTKYALHAGQIIGSELSVLGINGNLAPVVDVNNNANNPVIGLRSYSDDATMVGELASAAIAGMAEYNVIGTAKHFPGHGDTATDSHYGLPMVDKSLDVLKEVELKPYEVAIDQGIEMIMTAHILYPQLESDKIVSNKSGEPESLPATMSDDILTGLLKGEMGFEGIIVTDAMNMAGISGKWDQVQSCVIAIQAGVDLICMPTQLYCQADLANLDAIINGIIAAVEDGTIPMERVNDAVTRILTVKENRGILDYKAEDYTLENAQAVVGCDANREMERELAAAAVTVVKNDGILPLHLTANSKVLMLVPYTNEISQMLMAWNRAKEAGLIPEGAEVDYFRFNSATISSALQEKLDWADTYIINSEISSTGRFTGNHWLYAMPTKLCDYAAANGKKAIISSVDKPYDVQMYANANAIVAAYGCKGSSVDPTEALIGGATGSAAAYGPNIIAAVEVILGTYGAQGKLPVNIPVFDFENAEYSDAIAYERGFGLTYEAKKPCEHTETEVVGAKKATLTEEGYTGDTICSYCLVTITAGEVIPVREILNAKLNGGRVVVAAGCEYTFTADGKLAHVVSDEQTIYICLSGNSGKTPGAETGDTVEVEVKSDGFVHLKFSGAEKTNYLHYYSQNTDGWDRCGSDNNNIHASGTHNVYLFKAIDGFDPDSLIPGYTQVTALEEGGKYLIVGANENGKYYVMAPSTSGTAADHIAELTTEEVTHVHSFGEWTVTQDPTCTETGIKERVCECGEKETEVIAALGHTEEVIPGKEATCTETGLTEGKKCSVCGEIITAQEEIPALGHTEEVIPGKDATCTETGLTEGKKCSVCGEIITAQEEIPALGHTEEVIPGKDATCTETGLTEGKKCSVCGEIITAQEEIPALGHEFKDGTCTRCGEKDPNYVEVIANGWSGYTLWKLTADGVLTISPSGSLYEGKCNMRHYWSVNGVLTLPWTPYAERITKIVVEDGVNGIGQMAFYGLPNLEEVVLADSVDKINPYAFKNCKKLTTINLDVVEYICEGAFYACESLQDIDLAEGTKVDDFAFSRTPFKYLNP